MQQMGRPRTRFLGLAPARPRLQSSRPLRGLNWRNGVWIYLQGLAPARPRLQSSRPLRGLDGRNRVWIYLQGLARLALG